MPTFDVIVVGAGASGLAAAATLARSHYRVCVLEARDRIGGRILSRHEPDFSLPVELGAEFIHGRSPETFYWLQRLNLAAVDAAENRWSLRDGKLMQGDGLFEEMKKGLAKTLHPKNDVPFASFLDSAARKTLSPRAREFAKALVEGFDAADSTRVSTLQTLKVWSGSGGADAPTFRVIGGYSALVRGMAATLDPAFVETRLSTIVREINWSSANVTVEATQGDRKIELSADRIIVTLPLGVLQLSEQSQDAVRFVPTLKQKRNALLGLSAGPVLKLGLRFRHAFWERLKKGRYCDAAFFHFPNAEFPTFWTQLPLRAPLLTAWAGGPNAMRLSGRSESQLVDRALQSLENAFGRRTTMRSDLQATYLHDWQADPFARGAYSYVNAGGGGARKSLAAPIQNTIFFAGEAADTQGESGTVAGALQSGAAAAHKIIAANPRR